MKLTKFFLVLFFLNNLPSFSQVNFNANTQVTEFDGDFLYGSNMGYYNNWTDADVGDILTGNPERNKLGVGANSLRPALYENFCEKYGYDSRVPFFKHYLYHGAANNTVFIGDRPTFFEDDEDATHQENAYYCKDVTGSIIKVDENGHSLRSLSYKNLYDPIWIKEGNKMVINKNNIYAYYVYQLVEANKDYIKFYEIKNEPDFTNSNLGDKASGEDGNWWDQNPDPAALPNLYAPIQSYVRMLRISYEVIKTLSPDSYVCVGGLGYASFLDAILRNTDNPDKGKVTNEYPNYGGAWFDCLSYHIYPMYYLKEWKGYDQDHPDGFEYSRHSDAAVDVVIKRKQTLENILAQYGYDGEIYPKKNVIITETNVPNKLIHSMVDKEQNGAYYIGGESVQRNYLLKLAAISQKEGVKGIHVYGPNDNKEQYEDGREYDYKGFYYVLPSTPNGTIREHESAKGWRTISALLKGKKYNASATLNLNLPNNISGAAFGEGDDIIYALWAKTTKDLDESASAEFTFPDSLIASVSEVEWDMHAGKYIDQAISGREIKLTENVGFYMPTTLDSVPVTKVELNQKSAIRIKEKANAILTATVFPQNASNKKIEWSSTNPDIASVADGYIKGLKAGTTNIIANTVSGNYTDSCKVLVEIDTIPLTSATLSQATLTLKKGSTYQLTATILPNNATVKEVGWGTNASYVATVNSEGLVTAVGLGEANIGFKTIGTDKGGNNLRAQCDITVVENDIPLISATLEHTTLTLKKGETYRLTPIITPTNATVKEVGWGTNASYVATVNSEGLITAVGIGKANIGFKTIGTDKGGNNLRARCDIIVIENEIPLISATLEHTTLTLKKGETYKLTPIITPANASVQEVGWGTNASYVATINGEGLITAVGVGKANVGFKTVGTDKGGNNLRAHCDVIVIENDIPLVSATLEHTTLTLKKGETYKLTPIITPANATVQEVGWGTNASYVATINSEGLITAVGVGKANVGFKTAGTDKGGNNLRAHCDVIVIDSQPTKSQETDDGIKITAYNDILHLEAMSIINSVIIYDQTGNVIRNLTPKESNITIQDLPQGILLIHLETETGSRIIKKILMN